MDLGVGVSFLVVSHCPRVAVQVGLRFVGARAGSGTHDRHTPPNTMAPAQVLCKLTWLVLGGDPAARSHRVEQLTAL